MSLQVYFSTCMCEMFVCIHVYSILLLCVCVCVSVCVCVFSKPLQCSSVNLICHVETSAWHFSPLVLHGEQRARPTTGTAVRAAAVLSSFSSGWSCLKSLMWPLQMRVHA